MEKRLDGQSDDHNRTTFYPLRFLWVVGFVLLPCGAFMVYLAIREKLSSEPNDLVAGVAASMGSAFAMSGIFAVMGWWMLGDLPIHSTGNIHPVDDGMSSPAASSFLYAHSTIQEIKLYN